MMVICLNSLSTSPSTTSNISDNQHIQTIYALPDIIRQHLEALVVFLGRLTDLPINSLIRTDSLYSAARPSALFHLVHLYLELVWNVIQGLWEVLILVNEGNVILACTCNTVTHWCRAQEKEVVHMADLGAGWRDHGLPFCGGLSHTFTVFEKASPPLFIVPPPPLMFLDPPLMID